MAGRGFRIADAYIQITTDLDDVRRGVNDIPAKVGPDADKAGRSLGDKMGKGLAASVESWSAKVAKSRRAEVDAANAVTLAEKRLSEARSKGLTEGSARALSLTQALEKAQYRLAEAQQSTITSTNKLGAAQRAMAAAAGPDAEKAGRDLGGKLSQGIHLSIVRNSPLIAAAVGAALVAGAPLALTGATALFAGIGIVSAAQSAKVQTAWLNTWERVKTAAQEDARAIEPILVGLADRVGDQFDRMRPLMRGIFEDAAPQIDVFASGLLNLSGNALPGFVRAVERGMPVTMGFGDFLAKTGTGMTDFLDRMTSHAPEAGAAFSGLGDTMATLLPILGELLGQGAELATIILPALNGALGLTLSVLTALGPALPAIITGFGAMKIAQTASGWIGGLTDKFNALDVGSGRIRGGFDKLAGVMTPVNVATGALAIGVGIVTAAIQASDDQVRQWSEALREGGAAARLAGDEMTAHEAKIRELSSGVKGATIEVSGMSGILGIFKDDADEARQATEDWMNSLTPQARAAEEVKIATADLADAVHRYGSDSPQAAAASRELTSAQEEQASANAELEQAISGVTTAMIDQANQAMAAADSSFGYRQAQVDLENQMISYQAVVDDSTSSSLDLRDAMLDLEKDTLGVATAAGQLAADSLPAATSELERQQIAASAMLTELVGMRQEMGDNFPPALNATIAGLQASGATINGVNANTVSATGQVRNFIGSLTDLGSQHPVPTADLDSNALQNSYASSMNVLGILSGQRPLPIANLNNAPLSGQYASAMNVLAILSGQRPSPIATLYASTGSAEAALNYTARNRSATIFANVVTSGSAKIGGAIGGIVHKFADGGFEPMKGGIAQVVKPNTWRVIGDRVVDDEAYIPINDDTRSREILKQTANRMGFGLTQMAAGAAAGVGSSGVANPVSGVGMGSVRDVHFHLNGTVDFTDRRSLRTAAEALHAEFLNIERARS